MLAELLGCGRSDLFLRAADPLDPGVARAFERSVARRQRREPLQHILGRWPFLGLELRVDRRALVPRPETEDLVLEALRKLPESGRLTVADVGTGGGCIALAVASQRPEARLVAIDRSRSALELAAENVAETGLSARVGLVAGDLLAPLAEGATFDLVVANLPYVASHELSDLQPEVREWDPHEALVGGADGLDPLRRLAAQARSRLVPGGWLFAEIAPAQHVAAGELFAGPEWAERRAMRDRFGRRRIAAVRRA